MIVSLDLAKTYGQQNSDIAKKNKINKIDMNVNLFPDTDSASSNSSIIFGPINIDSNSNIEYKNAISSSNNYYGNDFQNLTGIYAKTDYFPSYYGVAYYKNYTINIDLSDNAYQSLKYINSIIPIISTFNGTRYMANSPDNNIYTLFTKLGTEQPVGSSLPYILSNEIETAFNNIDLKQQLDNIDNSIPFAGVEQWQEINSITNNEYYEDNNQLNSPINAFNELLNLIQDASDNIIKTNRTFSQLTNYINPTITNWNNNGKTLTININIPTGIYLFLSENGYVEISGIYGTETQKVDCYSKYDNFSLYKYIFSQLNISFIIDYTVQTEQKSYYMGNRNYSSENSFLFTEGVVTSNTPHETVTIQETGQSAIYYDNYYDKEFADYIYEKYQNGKTQLDITYPVGNLKTINGIDIVYSEKHGLITNIGNEYFDINGYKITIDIDDNIATTTQIPEGTLCYITKNGEVYYKNADSSPKLFVVQTSNLVYQGILVNELTLIESSEQFISAFDEMSWAEIDALGKIGELDKHLSVGDKKYVYISNQPELANPVPFVILGFNHDDLSNENGKAGMTVGMETVLADEYQLNSTNITPIGWSNCDFRTQTIPQLMKNLPSDLQSIIKTVNKTSVTDNTNKGNYSTTNDTLFLLSFVEIVGENYMLDNSFLLNYFGYQEGRQYDYWKTIKNGRLPEDRKKLDYVSYNIVDGSMQPVPVEWVTRSVQQVSFGAFGNISSDGELTSTGTLTNKVGISYAFCIGEKK